MSEFSLAIPRLLIILNFFFFFIFTDTEASTILGMQTTWFAVVLVLAVLSMAGFIAAAILCCRRHRVMIPRHAHNAHNAQPHPPVSFPCESKLNLHIWYKCALLSSISVSAKYLSKCPIVWHFWVFHESGRFFNHEIKNLLKFTKMFYRLWKIFDLWALDLFFFSSFWHVNLDDLFVVTSWESSCVKNRPNSGGILHCAGTNPLPIVFYSPTTFFCFANNVRKSPWLNICEQRVPSEMIIRVNLTSSSKRQILS